MRTNPYRGSTSAAIVGGSGAEFNINDNNPLYLVDEHPSASTTGISANSFIHSGAFIDRLRGDEAIGFFVPGLAGPNYARRALESAKELLIATGHTEKGGPWIPVGAGVHFGNAYMGMVGSPTGLLNFTALGDDVNVGARIASAAGPGELLASLELCGSANVDTQGLEHRELSLKGKHDPMQVVVFPLD